MKFDESPLGSDAASAVGVQSVAVTRCPDLAEPLCAQLTSVRQLVTELPAPRCDHRKHEDPAFAKQILINSRIVLADLFWRMGDVELDRSAATRLEIYEQQPLIRAE